MFETTGVYYAPFVISLMISSGLVWMLRKRQPDTWVSPMSWMMLAISVWNAAYIGELSSSDLSHMKFYINVEFIGIVAVPVLWLIFALRFSSSDQPVSKLLIAALCVIPFFTVIFSITNDAHGWMRNILGVRQFGPLNILEKTYGSWFWVHLVYSNVLMVIGTVILLRSALFRRGLLIWQKRSMVLGLGLPWLANFLYLFNFNPIPGLDLTPLFFSLAGLALYWASFTLQMIDLLPIARGAVMDNLKDLVLVENLQQQVVDLNPAALSFFQLPRDQVIGRRLVDIFPSAAPLIMHFANVLDGYEEIQTQLSWYEVGISMLRNRRGKQVGRLLSLRDITNRKMAEQELISLKEDLEKVVQQRTCQLKESQSRLQISQAQMEAIFNNVAAGIVLLDRNGCFLQFNDTWAAMLGYHRDELVQFSSRDIVFGKEIVFDEQWFLMRTGGRNIPYRCEEHFVCQDGRPFWGDLSVTPVFDQQGALESLLCVIIDITDRKRYEQQMLHNAMHDSLTGLPNRNLFIDRLGQELRRSHLYGESAYSVLYLDFDHFKDVNDSLGHNFGDHLLIQSAARLKKIFLPTDTFARVGGDEFLILLDNEKEPNRVLDTAERVLSCLKEPFLLNGKQVVVSASIGILQNLVGYQKIEDVMRDADIAMYRAKMRGRNRFEVFDTEMRARALARLEQEIGLRSALRENQLYLDFQPIIDMASQKVIGFEALVRWLSPQHGMIFPGEFISLAEETGIIYEMGQWVLEEACRNMVEWQRRFPTDPPLSISVNLSPRQFNDPGIKDQIARVLAETGLPPQSLRVEITEGMLLDDLESTERTLVGLRDMGVQTMIDDFGTGYSSLSYLHRFPISTLKIDRAFISRLDCGDPSQSGVEIVRAILAMAREMNIRVVAEGIETYSQMEILRHMSCDYGQGFLISRPISKGSVEIYLRGQSSASTDRPTIPISRRDTIFNYTVR